jgi:hypothetical protein
VILAIAQFDPISSFMPYYISPPPPNLLTRIITAIIAVFVLVGSFMIGMVALLVVGGIGLLAGLALWIRIAWVKRQLRKSGVDLNPGLNAGMNAGMNSGVSPQRESGDVIDAEYTVVSVQKNDQDT